MKMQGKIEDNAEAFESEDSFMHRFLMDLIHSDSYWRLVVDRGGTDHLAILFIICTDNEQQKCHYIQPGEAC